MDIELTRTIDRAFRGQPAGAVAVVEVETGRVLALYSKPSLDPNPFATGMTREEADDLRENMFNPWLDRTLGGVYYPGSTFKIVTALAALEGGFVTPDETIHCQGYHELGGRTFRCSQPHGTVTLHDAIARSCNVFFYNLAQRVGIDRIALMARDLGFGSPTGLGLNFEAPGLVETKDRVERRRIPFVQGFTLNAAIGQGSTQVNLLQLAMAYAAVANGGILYVPQIVQEVRRADGSVVSDESFHPRVRRRIGASREHLALLQQALWGVVNEEEGTAFEYRLDGVDASGKTGTAQVDRSLHSRGQDPRRTWYMNRDHAWFAGYAPADRPEIAVVVLVEHGGQGGKNAAPIALRIMRDYLQNVRPEGSRPSLAPLADDRSRRPTAATGATPASTH
jgi:penicillin-binding protein 2